MISHGIVVHPISFMNFWQIKNDMQDIRKVELHPKYDGKQMIMVIHPL